ncbi:unnamed protein product, partial [Aphanomyces euteiches]
MKGLTTVFLWVALLVALVAADTNSDNNVLVHRRRLSVESVSFVASDPKTPAPTPTPNTTTAAPKPVTPAPP